jgi:hypothetical protein
MDTAIEKPCTKGSSPCTCGTDGPHVTPNEIAAYRKAAQDQYGCPEIDFDENASVTEPSEGGAFVQAWVYIERSDTRLCADERCDEIVGDGGDGYDGYCAHHTDRRAVASTQ